MGSQRGEPHSLVCLLAVDDDSEALWLVQPVGDLQHLDVTHLTGGTWTDFNIRAGSGWEGIFITALDSS